MLRTDVEIDAGKNAVIDVEVSGPVVGTKDTYAVDIEEVHAGEVVLQASADLLREVAVKILNNTPGRVFLASGVLRLEEG